MSALDAKIDDLYRLPLADFTAARNALAKSLAGDEAKRVRQLEKPTVVPWAVNQVYWRARSTFDRVMKSGEKLRAAQVAALEGRAADVRGASEAHRRAIGDAVAEAERLSAEFGAKPGGDALARTFESLSLATARPDPPGRLTEALQPAGFEALAGLTDIKVRSEKLEGRSGRVEGGGGEWKWKWKWKWKAGTGQAGRRRTHVERRTTNEERRTPNAERGTPNESRRVSGGKRSRPRRGGAAKTGGRHQSGRREAVAGGSRRTRSTPGLGTGARRSAGGEAGAHRSPT